MNDINGYQLLELLGQGSFAETYKAVSPNGELVALKLIREEALQLGFKPERFHNEVRGLRKATGRNVVKMLDDGEVQIGRTLRQYIVMEYLDGTDLKVAFAQANQQFEESQLRNILYQIVVGLETIHKQNIIHRDLKPPNIYLTDGGVIKLLDFGLAKLLDYTTLTTLPGRPIGTALYMAPEILRDDAPHDIRADFYSLGVLTYFLLTKGQYPLHARTPLEFYRLLVESPPNPPTRHNRSLSPEFENLILTLLSKEPYERNFTHDELKEAISNLPIFLTQMNRRPAIQDVSSYSKSCYFHVLHNEKSVVTNFLDGNERAKTNLRFGGIVYGANFLPRYRDSLSYYTELGIPYFFDPVAYRFQYSVFSQTVGLVNLPYAADKTSVLTPKHLQTLKSQQEYVKKCIDWQLQWGCSILVAPFHFSRDMESSWMDVDIKLIEEAVAYARQEAPGKPVYAGVCTNIEVLTDESARNYLLNRYSRGRAEGYLFYIDGIDERNNIPLQVRAFYETLKLFQRLGKPVIAGKVGTLGIALLAAGIDGITNGIGSMTKFDESNLKKPPDGGGPPSYYIPQLMLTLPPNTAEDILSTSTGSDFRCDCPHCGGSFRNLKSSAKPHFVHIRNQEVHLLNSMPTDAQRIQWLRKRLEIAIEGCKSISKIKTIDFNRSYFQHLITWLDIFTQA